MAQRRRFSARNRGGDAGGIAPPLSGIGRRRNRPDAPLDLLTGVYGGKAVAALFGLPIVYAADNWPNVEHRYLSPEEMACIQAPDLDANPFFQRLLAQVARIIEIEGRCAGFLNWQGVINNAQQLRERQRRSGTDYRFATVSNCVVNMVSPQHYREFLPPCDLRIADAFESIGVHNCAWRADPYVESYASIPNLADIEADVPDQRVLSAIEICRELSAHQEDLP